MKKLLLLFVVSCFAVSIKAQNATRGTEQGVKQPDIIVTPFTKQGDDVRTIIEENPMMSLAISKVKEAFNERGFITRDFIALAKRASTQDILTHGSQSDAKAKIVQGSKADIEVNTKIFVNKTNGASEVSLELQAYEVHTGSSLANVSYLSGKFNTDDTLRLANRALGMIKDDFFYQLQSSFEQIVENGRELSIQIVLGENCELDVYTEVGTNGNDLQIEVEDWLVENAYKGVYSVNSSDKMLEISMQIPLINQADGRPYQPSRLRGTLTNFLKGILEPTGHSPKTRANIGQTLVIAIE